MDQHLPPLSTLPAFEAAGRLSSFTRAARELNITQAAVSRQIRLLEQHLGKPLFLRAHRAVQLTPEGRAYLHAVVNGLSHVRTATQAVSATPPAARLTIAADLSMAELWLMPRLAGLRGSLPNVDLRLLVSDDEPTCLSPTVDVALIHGEGTWPTHDCTLLFSEEVFPVCSPTHPLAKQTHLSPAQIASETLIDLDDDHWSWMNWRQWFVSHGDGAANNRPALTISSYPLVLEAARQGLGVALGWRGLVDADLASGRLVAPLGQSLKTRFGYYLLWPRGQQPSLAVTVFREWAIRMIGLGSETGSKGRRNSS